MAHNNLGLLLLQRGSVNEALYYLERATTLNPLNSEAHNNLGYALQEKGRLKDAMAHYEEAMGIRPSVAIYEANLGKVLALTGQVRDAIRHYESAVNKAPSDPNIASNLAWLLATDSNMSSRNGPRAVELAERASRLTSEDNPQIVGTLAAAYAAAGRFDEAIATAEKSRGIALANGDKWWTELNTELLKLYRVGQPYPASR